MSMTIGVDGRVNLTLEVNPAHLDALDNALVMLDAALQRGIDKIAMKAAGGNIAAGRKVDEYRAVRRYVGELSSAIAFAREITFSNEGSNNAKG